MSIQEPSHDGAVVVEIPRDPGCGVRARRLVRDYLGRDVDQTSLERALLTVTELVTNAWKHGEGKIELRLVRSEARVRLEVTDQGTGNVPAIRKQARDSDGGWGLRIVDEISLQWGCYEGTTHVWAVLSLDEPR